MFPVAIADQPTGPAGIAFLTVAPDGSVELSGGSIPSADFVSIGEIQFRPDA